MSHGGKGDKPRPFSVSQEEFDNRWETIFKQPNTNKIGDKIVQQVQETIEKAKDEDRSSQV